MKDLWLITRMVPAIIWYLLPIEIGIYYSLEYGSPMMMLLAMPVAVSWFPTMGLLGPLLFTPKVGQWLRWNVLSWERMWFLLESIQDDKLVEQS